LSWGLLDDLQLQSQCDLPDCDMEALRRQQQRAWQFEVLTHDMKKEVRHEMVNTFVDRENRATKDRWTTADFKPMCVLGRGGYGVVHLVKTVGNDRAQRPYALKQFSKRGSDAGLASAALFERNALLDMNSRWVCKLYATFHDAEFGYMLMEFLQGGALASHLCGMRTKAARFYMAELLEAIDAVHQCGCIHHDLKPMNIMLTRHGHIKLIDFGSVADPDIVAQKAEKGVEKAWRYPLTFAYASPECISRQPYSYDHDIWAFGVISIQMLLASETGPFDWMENYVGTLPRTTFLKCQSKLKEWLDLGSKSRRIDWHARCLLEKVLCPRKDRFDIAQIRQSPVFRGVDFTNIFRQSTADLIDLKLEGPDDTRWFSVTPAQKLPEPPSEEVRHEGRKGRWQCFSLNVDARQQYKSNLEDLRELCFDIPEGSDQYENITVA